MLQCKTKAEASEGWVAKNQNLVRASPLVAGGVGVFSVILNRSFSGVSSSEQYCRSTEPML